MSKMQTLRQFIEENDYNPEDGARGIEWFNPNSALWIEAKRYGKDGQDTLHIFSDGETKCGLLSSCSRSDLFDEDQLAFFIDDNEEYKHE
jgi:hypothetical protein